MLLKALRVWSPWSPAEGLRWLTLVIVGPVVCLVAWLLAANEGVFGHQVKWAALSMGGFLVVAYADVIWLLRARWSIVQRRQRLFPDEPVPATRSAAPDTGRAALVVAGDGLDHFHLPDCP